MTPDPARVAAAIHALKSTLGDRLKTGQSVRDQHGHGEAYRETIPPDAVAFPLTTEEVSAVAATCSRFRVPLIPYGVGTSLEGQVTRNNFV